jgi:predicted dehydrogenase
MLDYYRNNSDGVEVVACVDPIEASRQRFSQQFDIDRQYPDIAALVKDCEVDVLDLCSPPQTHAEQIVQAAGLGKTVLSEKPLAVDYRSAAEAVRIAEEAGIKVGIMQNYRWRPEYVDARDSVQSGRIGRPMMVNLEAMLHWHGGAPYRRAADRMIIIELAVHYIDLLRFILGADVTSIYAVAGRPADSKTVGETFTALTLKFDNGAVGTVINSGECQGARVNWGGATVIQGEDGTIYLNREELYTFGMYSAAAGGWYIQKYGPEHYSPSSNVSFTAPVRDFYRAIIAGKQPPVTARDNLNTLATTLAAYRSVETGEVVKIAEFASQQ